VANPFTGNTSTTTNTGENPHVKKMEQVRNPYTGFQSNKEIQAQKETSAQQQAPKRVGDSMESTATQKATSDEALQKRQEVAQLSKKIGNFAYEVEAEVNKFLNEGTANIGATGTSEPVFKDGVWTAGTAMGADYSDMAKQKVAELEGIKRVAKTFYEQTETGEWIPKQFDKVVSEYYDGLDDVARTAVDKKANTLTNIAKQINALENQGMGNGAQAQALRKQLQEQDEGGMVSGLYTAMEKFKKFVGGEADEDDGIKWSGDDGSTSWDINDILTLDEQKITEELRKAVTSSSGLFGGNFASNIAKTMDYESEEYVKAMSGDVEYKNQLLKSTKDYFIDKQMKLLDVAGALMANFDEIAPAIKNAVGDDVAEEWFVKLQKGDPKDFAMAVGDLIYDNTNGLGIETRQALGAMIGDVMKRNGVDLNVGEGDKLTQYIDQIATSGYLINDAGEKISPSAIQKLEILQAFDSGDYDKVDAVMNELITGGGIDLVKQVERLTNATTTSDIVRGLNEFKGSLTKSLQSFKGSETERMLAEVLTEQMGISAEDYNAMSPDGKQAVLLKAFRENPDLSYEGLKADMELKRVKVEKQAKQIGDTLQATQKQYQDQLNAIPALQQSLDNALTNATTKATYKVNDFFSDIPNKVAGMVREIQASQLAHDYNLSAESINELAHNRAMFSYLNQFGRVDPVFYEAIMSQMPQNFKTAYTQHNNDPQKFLQAMASNQATLTAPWTLPFNPTDETTRYNQSWGKTVLSEYIKRDPQYVLTKENVAKEMKTAREATDKLRGLIKQTSTAQNALDKMVKSTQDVMRDPNLIGSLVQNRAKAVEKGEAVTELKPIDTNKNRAGVQDYVNPVTSATNQSVKKSVVGAKNVNPYKSTMYRPGEVWADTKAYVAPPPVPAKPITIEQVPQADKGFVEKMAKEPYVQTIKAVQGSNGQLSYLKTLENGTTLVYTSNGAGKVAQSDVFDDPRQASEMYPDFNKANSFVSQKATAEKQPNADFLKQKEAQPKPTVTTNGNLAQMNKEERNQWGITDADLDEDKKKKDEARIESKLEKLYRVDKTKDEARVESKLEKLYKEDMESRGDGGGESRSKSSSSSSSSTRDDPSSNRPRGSKSSII